MCVCVYLILIPQNKTLKGYATYYYTVGPVYAWVLYARIPPTTDTGGWPYSTILLRVWASVDIGIYGGSRINLS